MLEKSTSGSCKFVNGRVYTEPIFLSRETVEHRPAMRRKHHLLDSLGSHLDDLDNWDAWFTFTWRNRVFTRSSNQVYVMNDCYDNISMEAIRRAMERWHEQIKPQSIFWATESGSINQRNHVHGLITFDGDKGKNADIAWKLAYRWFGRSEIEQYDRLKGASHYVGKYITKQLTDYDYWNAYKSGSADIAKP